MKIPSDLNQLSRVVQFLTILGCLAAIPAFNYAQDAGADGQTKPAAAADDHKPLALEPMTVTVTSQKEPEPALAIPLSVTAVSDSTILNADIQAVKEAADYSPNTFINEFTARALSNPYFRGIGGSPTNPGVTTVINGVPQLNSYSSNLEWTDVGQVEFVRGPEGALYGRNTAGGLINIVSRGLSPSWTTDAQAEFGNYNLRDLRASVSSPTSQRGLGFSLSGGYSARDGYTTNDYTGHDVDGRAAGFGKGQLFFKVNDRLQFRLILSGEHDRDGDYALGDLDYIRAHPNHVSRDFEGYNHRSVSSATLIADYHGSAVDISSITGGVMWRNHGLTDLDYGVATLGDGGLYATRDNVEQQYQFTQEFRFTSSKDKPLSLSNALQLHWQAGIFIFNQDYQQDATNDITSLYGFFPPTLSSSSADLGDWGVGVYGQTRFTAWKKLDLAAGLRFDDEDKNARLSSFGGPATNLGDNYSEVSPQFSVAYHFTEDEMAYVSASRGYKAGGFNPPPAVIESYGAEHTWNYEVGIKRKWLKSKLQTTVALFYIDWRNLQLNQQLPFGGGLYYIGNAGRANSKGVEFEARYRPLAWWEVFGSVGYTDARFLGGSTAFNANLGVNQAVEGNTLPYTPTVTTNIGTQVSWSPCRQAALYLRAEITRYGDFEYDASNAMSQPSYPLASFRAGVRVGHWFAEGWVDNAFDAHYVPIAIPYAQLGAPSGYVGESGAPVTYGGRAGINF
jgi:iron complex outermembrane receptor protein